MVRLFSSQTLVRLEAPESARCAGARAGRPGARQGVRQWLRRHPIDPWGARLARLVRRLLQNVSIHQVGQGRKDAGGIAGGLRGNLLEL